MPKVWSEDQVVEAFLQFRNPNSGSSLEEASAKLRKQLQSLGKSAFDSNDIGWVVAQFAPPCCADSLTSKVIELLEQN